MSPARATAAARAAAAPRTSPKPAARARPSLRLLPGQPARPLVPYVVLLLGLLLAGLVGLLLLNTWSSQDAFHLAQLQDRQATLDEQEQALVQQNRAATDPQTLAQRAAALHLAPATGAPAFVSALPDGRYVVLHTRQVVKNGVRQGNLLVVTPKAVPATVAASAAAPVGQPSAAGPTAPTAPTPTPTPTLTPTSVPTTPAAP